MTQYLVSIDLGTTNTVLAYALPGAGQVELLAIDQLVAYAGSIVRILDGNSRESGHGHA